MVLTHWQTRRARLMQKRKAIQLLAHSGVLRPGDVELRYGVSFHTVRAMRFAHEPVAARGASELKPALTQSTTSLFHMSTQPLHEWFRSAGLLKPVSFRRLFQLEQSQMPTPMVDSLIE